jgi:hypothetical protein
MGRAASSPDGPDDADNEAWPRSGVRLTRVLQRDRRPREGVIGGRRQKGGGVRFERPLPTCTRPRRERLRPILELLFKGTESRFGVTGYYGPVREGAPCTGQWTRWTGGRQDPRRFRGHPRVEAQEADGARQAATRIHPEYGGSRHGYLLRAPRYRGAHRGCRPVKDVRSNYLDRYAPSFRQGRGTPCL